MKKWQKLTTIIIISYLFLNLLAFVFLEGRMQTTKGCPCELQNLFKELEVEEEFTGEIPCNGVTADKPILISGILNIYWERHGKEIIVCEKNEKVDVYYKYTKSNIKFTSILK